MLFFKDIFKIDFEDKEVFIRNEKFKQIYFDYWGDLFPKNYIKNFCRRYSLKQEAKYTIDGYGNKKYNRGILNLKLKE